MSLGSIRVAKVLGIDIEINFTWIIVFFLVVFQLTVYFPTVYPQMTSSANILLSLVTAFMFFLSLLTHEMSHSLVANRNDLSIKKVTLFIFGGVAQMEEEPKDPRVELKMAIAGPLASILLGAIFFTIGRLAMLAGLPEVLAAPFLYLAPINLVLAAFNLIPGFPLDGGRVLRAIIWLRTDNMKRATAVAAKMGEAFAYFLMFSGFFIGVFLQHVEAVWFILIGWFLQNAAQSSYRQVVFESALSKVKVADIMSSDLYTVSADIVLDTMITDYFLKHKFRRFPVVGGEGIVGVVTLADIKEIPRERWLTTTVGDVVKELNAEAFVDIGEPVDKVIDRMAKNHISHFLVKEDSKIVGIVTRSDIVRVMRIKDELGIKG